MHKKFRHSTLRENLTRISETNSETIFSTKNILPVISFDDIIQAIEQEGDGLYTKENIYQQYKNIVAKAMAEGKKAIDLNMQRMLEYLNNHKK